MPRPELPRVDAAAPAVGAPVWPRAAAVIVAAGRGQRFGAADKVFLPLGGRPLLAHVLDAVAASAIAGVVLVVGEHTRGRTEALLAGGGWRLPVAVVAGGERRQDSVAAGVAAVPSEAEVVVVHDGARPLADGALFDRCAAAAALTGAAIAAVPVSDTLKRAAPAEPGEVAAGAPWRVAATVPRDGLWAAQTPQAFRRDRLVAALAHPAAQAGTFTDEAALFEALGWPVALVPGSATNLKVTHPDDLLVAEALLAARRAAGLAPEGSR